MKSLEKNIQLQPESAMESEFHDLEAAKNSIWIKITSFLSIATFAINIINDLFFEHNLKSCWM